MYVDEVKEIHMHGRAILAGIAMLFASAGPVVAQTASDFKACTNKDDKVGPVDQIRACSVFLRTRRAISGKPAPMDALSAIAYFRASAYIKRGEIDLAIADYDLGLTFNPANYSLYQLRGYAYHQKGDFVRALNDYNDYIKASPSVENPAALSVIFANRGSIRMEQRDYTAAMTDLNEAIRLHAENGFAFYMRGQVFQIRDDDAQAKSDYQSAVRFNPNLKPLVESAVATHALNRAWANYLTEIQNDGDFANWSSPPLDALRRSQQ